VLYCFHKCWI